MDLVLNAAGVLFVMSLLLGFSYNFVYYSNERKKRYSSDEIYYWNTEDVFEGYFFDGVGKFITGIFFTFICFAVISLIATLGLWVSTIISDTLPLDELRCVLITECTICILAYFCYLWGCDDNGYF